MNSVSVPVGVAALTNERPLSWMLKGGCASAVSFDPFHYGSMHFYLAISMHTIFHAAAFLLSIPLLIST